MVKLAVAWTCLLVCAAIAHIARGGDETTDRDIESDRDAYIRRQKVIYGMKHDGDDEKQEPEQNQFEVSLNFTYKRLKVDDEGLPDRVKQEARYPTLASPWSGNTWAGTQYIGRFDKNDANNPVEAELGFRYIPKIKSPVRPFFGLNLQLAHCDGTDGDYGGGYTYSKDMRKASPSEWVLYIYGVEYFACPVEPVIGIEWQLNKYVRLFTSAGYEYVRIRYYKGIEGFGKPHWEKLGETHHNLFNPTAGVSVCASETEIFSIKIGGTCGLGSDMRGFGGTIGFCFRF